MKHYVYVIQNKINYKIYVGYSSNPAKRWDREKSAAHHYKDNEYNTALSRAIRKYGWENFSKTIIEKWDNVDDALEAEKFWIEFFRTNVCVYGPEFGYNLDCGGGLPPNHTGKKRTEEHKKIISDTHRGKIISEEHKKIIGDASRGRIILEEMKQYLSDINKDKIFSEEIRNKISLSKIGKMFSEEHKTALSISKKKNYELGNIVVWNKGIPTKEETKLKISEANRKLSNEQILAIKSDDRSLKEIAEEYGVSESTIRRAKK